MKRIALFALAALAAAAAHGRITEIDVQLVEPFADGASFGSGGAYERIKGVARGELDPAHPRNQGIVNLARAPKNARGNVEYEVEWFMLRPVNGGNRTILYEVTNRGRKFLLHWLMDGPAQAAGATNDPKTLKDAGNALFFRMGYTMLWSGWDPDVPRTNQNMAINVPTVANVQRVIRDELVSGTRAPQSETFRLSYEAATLDQTQARLTQRRKEADARVEVPAAGWGYLNSREIRLLPAGTKPLPGSLYELHYPAKDPKVLGIGFAATRDLVAFLRNEAGDERFAPNPAGRGIRATLAVGISQSGRYLRDFVHQGYNQDEARRKVFDGMLAHISGVGGVFLNAEFAQPFRTNTQHEDHHYPENAFPFSAARTRDPLTRRKAGLLRRDGFDPLWMESNTSTEYWQKAASLLHTDPLGRADLKLPANARVYLIAGTQHGGRAGLTDAAGPCANPRNPHSPAPALRALLVALDQWVGQGTAPPASRVPSIASKTLGSSEGIGFPKLPGVAIADFANRVAQFGDWIQPRVESASPFRPLVPAVDADGNEVAGIRLPDIAVPLATYTGWNLYKAPFTEGELCDRDGSYIAFPTTQAERTAKRDPRRSLDERYAGHAEYAEKVVQAAGKLVKERLLLAEDAERYASAARSPELAKRFAR